jgi:hypothetical protein
MSAKNDGGLGDHSFWLMFGAQISLFIWFVSLYHNLSRFLGRDKVTGLIENDTSLVRA